MPKLKFNVPVKLVSGQVEQNDGSAEALLNKTEIEQLIGSSGSFPLDINDGNANDVAGILQEPTTSDGAKYISGDPVTSFYINPKQLAAQVKNFGSYMDYNKQYALGRFYSKSDDDVTAYMCADVLSLCTIFFEATGYGYPGVFLSSNSAESGIVINTTDQTVVISDWGGVSLPKKTAYLTVDNAYSYFKEIDANKSLIDQLYEAGFFEICGIYSKDDLFECLQQIQFVYFNPDKTFTNVYSFNKPFSWIPSDKKLAWMPGLPALDDANDGDVIVVNKTVAQDVPELNEDLVSIAFNTELSTDEVNAILYEVFGDLTNDTRVILGDDDSAIVVHGEFIM